MTISVRPFRKSDAKAVCGLFREFVSYLRNLDYKSGKGFTEAAFLRDSFGSNRALNGWVAVHGKEVIGYLMGHFAYNVETAQRLFFVVDFFVSAAHRQKGAGFSLMRAAAAYAKTKGAQGMTWDIYKPDRNAFKFYSRLGARKRSNLEVMLLDEKPFNRLAKPRATV